MSILVMQYWDTGRPGRLGATLRDHAFSLDVRRMHAGDALPPDLDDVDGVIALGGPQHAHAPDDAVQRGMDFIRAAHERSLPVVGVCLGCQMIARALGGEVAPMARPEIGFFDINIGPAGHTDTILAGVPWKAPALCWHGDEVTKAPPGAVVLASSAACKVQAFRVGMRTYAFQFHFEADGAILREMIAASRDELASCGVPGDDLVRQSEAANDRAARVGDRISLNIASLLIPRMARAVM